MKISCICPTYARPHLLEESIESFLRQDYKGEKQLIILNDCPDQEFVFSHPDVTIINTDVRFPTLGEKYNFMFNLASGDYLTPWEDDDIFLPHRLSYAATRIQETGADYHKLPHAYFWNYGNIDKIVGNLFFCAGMWSRELLERTTACDAVNTAADRSIEDKLKSFAREYYLQDLKDPRDIYYIYRWGGVTSHLSGYGDAPDALARAQESLKRNMTKGRIELKPKWNIDYCRQVDEFLTRSKGT